jgi:hypothetical protein
MSVLLLAGYWFARPQLRTMAPVSDVETLAV